MDLGLGGRRVVVVGGSSGIGLACAELLCEEGAQLLIVGRRAELLEVAMDRLRRRGGNPVWSHVGDVVEPGFGEELLGVARERMGGIDGLINSAGSSRAVSLDDVTDSDWEAQWELNVTAIRHLMDAVAPAMAQQGGGAIVNVCSSAGRRPSNRDPAYAVAKRGELVLSEVYAQRYAPRGVRVNAVAPGPTATPLWMGPGGLLDQVAAESGKTRDEALREQSSKLPFGRLGEPEEVAAVVVTILARNWGSGGAAWPVDGGHVPEVA